MGPQRGILKLRRFARVCVLRARAARRRENAGREARDRRYNECNTFIINKLTINLSHGGRGTNKTKRNAHKSAAEHTVFEPKTFKLDVKLLLLAHQAGRQADRQVVLLSMKPNENAVRKNAITRVTSSNGLVSSGQTLANALGWRAVRLIDVCTLNTPTSKASDHQRNN